MIELSQQPMYNGGGIFTSALDSLRQLEELAGRASRIVMSCHLCSCWASGGSLYLQMNGVNPVCPLGLPVTTYTQIYLGPLLPKEP